MQIDVFNQFDAIILCTLAMNIIIPNLKENRHSIVELYPLYVFHIKPRPLHKMRAIANKNNSAQLDHSTKLLTKFYNGLTYSF